MNDIIFTQKGFSELEKEKEELRLKRKEAVIDLKKARDMGDLSENGYYKAARFKLNDIDRRIRFVNHLLKTGIVKQAVKKETVDIGCLVTVSSEALEKTYEIVGGFESNPLEGKLSLVSPLGRALLGKKKNDTVSFPTPTGEKIFTIISLSYVQV